jgi:hypothetical protein
VQPSHPSRASAVEQVPYDAVKQLVKLRGAILAVSAGETDGDSMASSMVMSMMGQSYGDSLYGNRRGQREVEWGAGANAYGGYDEPPPPRQGASKKKKRTGGAAGGGGRRQ